LTQADNSIVQQSDIQKQKTLVEPAVVDVTMSSAAACIIPVTLCCCFSNFWRTISVKACNIVNISAWPSSNAILASAAAERAAETEAENLNESSIGEKTT
jgi:hypothetical protein